MEAWYLVAGMNLICNGEHEVTHCGVTKVASCRPSTPHSEHWVLDAAILKLELIELREMNVVLRSWGRFKLAILLRFIYVTKLTGSKQPELNL